MADRQFRTVFEGGSYFEGPRWHEGSWWVSDFYRHGVFAVTPDGAEELVLEVEGQPSGLGWMPDGSLLVVSMKTHELLRRAPDGSVSVHADLTEHCGGHLNDLVVDHREGQRQALRACLLLAGGDQRQCALERDHARSLSSEGWGSDSAFWISRPSPRA
jgi:hypothetical protein